MNKAKEGKEHELARMREEKGAVEQKEAELQRDIVRLQQAIKNLKLQKQDGTRLFGPKVPEVLLAIEKERRWKKRPIGPIGKSVLLVTPLVLHFFSLFSFRLFF